MTTIKITELTNIGTDLASSTVLPVVNMAGTPTTEKAVLGNIANLVLAGAGGNYVAAAVATLAQSVTNAAQPNITSVGTLGNVVVSGNANVGILKVSGTSNLGAVGNVYIAGGTDGYVLQTDGAGNLSWTAQTGNGGNGSVGGANTQVQFNDAGSFGGNTGFTFNKTTGIFTSPFLAGNGNGLSNIQGANVSGAVGLATYATTANAVAGANVSGFVPNANVANTAFAVAAANVSGLGNIATLSLDGNTSNVLYGNGVFAAVSNPFDQDLNTTDNVQFANVTSTDAIRFSNSGNIVGALGYAPTYVSIEGYQSNSVNITANDIYTWSFDNNGVLSKSDANGLVLAANYSAQIITDFGDNDRTWTFDGGSGELVLPGGNVLIDPTDDNFEVRGAQAVNFEANTVVNIYTDTSNSAYQWQFGDDGNLTLPGNTFAVNYANGDPVSLGSGYIIPYEVATFVANTQPGFGEIQFADSEGANSAPATAQKLFINESPTNEQSMGTIFQQWTSNSYRGTLSLNNGSDSQATFNISNGRIYFNPETYRGFNAGLNQIWGDDCSINQLIITNATAPKFYNTDFLVEEDVFHATGLATGNTHVMLNIYGSSQYNPINPNDLWNTFVAFVDNVLYDNTTLRTNPDDIKTQFYNNTGSFRNNIPTQDLYQYFRFTSSSDADYFGTAPTTGGSGTGATVRIRVNPNNTYTVLGTALPGVGYIGGETLTVLGTDLGGATPANDLTILIDSVDGDGVITAVSYDSGTGVYPWPTNSISDGSDDQYDTGNYLNTNLASEISYANGITQTASAAFGGGDYCVMYYQSFFCMVATGVGSSVSDLFYSGNLGFDGDGDLNWTGLRSNQSVIANNNALYAYFDSEYLDGELTPTVGTTYNMTLDSAGINLDGFYAYYDTDTSDTFFGSNTDWRLESQSQLFVQSYNEMIIQTLVNQRGIGETGPALTVQAGDGSPGQKEINATAGNGGTVNVRGGDAGGSDGIDSLGNTGGSVNITGGVGSGNSQAGNVEINGGEGNNSGSINLRTDYGSNSTGKITLNTGGNGTTNTWEFRPDGSTIFPTLTVDIHNGGNQQAQTLQFGDNTQQAIITGPTPDVTGSAQRLIIQGQRGSGTGEGGDVYLWGGDSDLYGGDIKIYAGDADNVSSGSGGYVNIAGGDGFDLGGYVSMQGGESSNGQGAPASVIGGYGQSGGFANIVGGQGYAGPGGNVNITGGTSGNGLAEYGNVNIGAGASIWSFDNTGNLVLPGNTFSVNYANGAQVNIGGGGSGNTGNVTFDDVTVQGVNQLNLSAGPDYTANLAYLQVRAGDVASHIHFDTGNNEAYDLIVGNDQKFVQVSSTGNIIMSSYDSGNAVSYAMTLDTTGNLILPGTINLAGGTGVIESSANNVSIYSDSSQLNGILFYGDGTGNDGVDIYGANGVTIFANNAGSSKETRFLVDGSISVQGMIYPTTGLNTDLGNATNTFGNAYFSGNVNADAFTTSDGGLTHSGSAVGINANAGKDIYLYADAANVGWTFGASGNLTAPGNIVIDDGVDGNVTSTGNINITSNNKAWTFGISGNLTLPGNTFAVNYANGTQVSLGGGVAEASFSIQSSNFNATAGSRYGVNTSGGAVTATLPASPSTGDAIFFADAGGAYSSNNLTIARNGLTIMGASSDLTVSTNNQSVGLFYNGSTWRTYNAG